MRNLDALASSAPARIFSPAAPGISEACSMMDSIEPHCRSSFAADFSPMPFTPGMLSEESPARAR